MTIDLSELKTIPDLGSAPDRVVSLVPSITDSLFALGFGKAVVGVTDYCIHPAEQIAALPHVGGPKNPDIEKITALSPDLVFVNQEDNSPEVVKALQAAGLRVWLSFPKSVEEALDVLRAFLAIFHTDVPAMQINMLQKSVDWARTVADNQTRIRYFCPIWQDEHEGQPWWMTFNDDTFSNDILSVVGGENIFAERVRRYPLAADLGLAEAVGEEGDTRYPRVTVEEIVAQAPEMLLLPSEPFHFEEAQRGSILEHLVETPAVKHGRIHFIDGSLVTWPGTRIGRALQDLPQYFA